AAGLAGNEIRLKSVYHRSRAGNTHCALFRVSVPPWLCRGRPLADPRDLPSLAAARTAVAAFFKRTKLTPTQKRQRRQGPKTVALPQSSWRNAVTTRRDFFHWAGTALGCSWLAGAGAETAESSTGPGPAATDARPPKTDSDVGSLFPFIQRQARRSDFPLS